MTRDQAKGEQSKEDVPPPAKRMRRRVKERQIPVQVEPISVQLSVAQIMAKMRTMGPNSVPVANPDLG